ncbi:MAG: PAS domain S-box protein [Bacteroidales bacterium]|nr:PAS domain S-box protein [Bacteroidales bacterium]MBN2817358.1 PAS domain S-box protein [Bacteroidales bacterium]
MGEAIFQSIYNSLEEIVVVIDEDFSIQHINAKGKEIFNSVEVIEGKKCFQIICNKAPDQDCPLKCLTTNSEHKVLKTAVIQGKVYRVSTSTIEVPLNGKKQYIDVLHDITDLVELQKFSDEKKNEYESLNEEYLTLVEELEEKNEFIENEKNKYENLFSHMNSAFAYHEIILDDNGEPVDYRFLDCNKRFEELTGLKKVDIVGKTVLEVLPGTEKYWIENFGKVALDRKPISFTNYSKDLDKYYETRSYSPSKDTFAVTFHDVTKRIKSEKALEIKNKEHEALNKELIESLDRTKEINTRLEEALEEVSIKEQLLQTVFNSAPICMMLLNERTEIVQMNAAGLGTADSLPPEVIGLRGGDVLKCIHAKDHPNGCGFGKKCKACKVRDTIEHTLKTGESCFKAESQLLVQKRQSGITELTVLVSTQLVTNNGQRNILVTIDDITQRKHDEDFLKDAHKQLINNLSINRSIIETAFDAFWSVDVQGNIVDANSEACRMLGYTKEEMLSLKIIDIDYFENKEVNKEHIQQVIEGKKRLFESKHIRKDGSIIDVEVNATYSEEKQILFVFLRDITPRKIQEYYLKKAQEIGSIGTWFIDIKANKITWTDEIHKIFNVPINTDIKYETFLNCVHPEDREMVNNAWKDAVLGKPYDIIHRILVNNKVKWVHQKANIEFDEHGVAYRAIGVTQDISVSKFAALRLEESEAKYHAAFKTSPDAININKLNGEYVEINDGFTELTGFTREDVVGKSSKDLNIWAIPQDRDYLIKQLSEKGYVENLESEFRCKDSSIKTALMSARLISLNGEKHILSITRDITQRKKSEQELLEQKLKIEKNNKRLESLLSLTQHPVNNTQDLLDYALHEAIKLTESKIGYIYYNNEDSKQFSLNTWSKEVMQECQVLNPQTIYNLDSTGCWGEAVRQRKPIIINDYHDDNPIKKGIPEGHVKLNKFLTIPVFSENRIVAVAGVANKTNDYDKSDIQQLTLLMDSVWKITERINLVNDLNIAKNKAEKADKLKTIFLANMSHEIRTPLNGIMGFTEILTTKKVVSDSQKNVYNNIIKKCSQNLLQIVNDILDISALEARTVDIFKKPFDVNLTLLEVYNIFNQKIQDSGKQLDLFVRKKSKTLILNNDETRLVQIYTNLLDNAIKFTDEGKIDFGISAITNNKIILFISDTGIGIPPDKYEIIFDRFRQGEESANRLYGGNGLGLSIVKQLINLMGGDIYVESQVGKGTSFYFDLPYEFKSETEDKNQTSEDLNDLAGGTKILIVEDDPVNVILLEEILGELNVFITSVSTGNAAVAAAKKETYDVILMDVQLPDISGLDAVRAIRKFDNKVPVIAQTAYAMKTDEAMAYDAGCNDYISKPIQRELLIAKIHKQIKK